MTSGVDSTPRKVLSGASQAIPKRCALVSLMSFNGLKRCSLQVRPGDIHCPGSRSAFSRRRWVTWAAVVVVPAVPAISGSVAPSAMQPASNTLCSTPTPANSSRSDDRDSQLARPLHESWPDVAHEQLGVAPRSVEFPRGTGVNHILCAHALRQKVGELLFGGREHGV